ncbi:MAG: 3-dehydroquinate synthase [Bacteroidales bacterium]|nr:3-dehydroquinate synthase [Bacteroidales bacterium]
MYKQVKLLDHYIITGQDSLTVFKTLLESGDYKDRSFFILTDENTSQYCLEILRDYIPEKTVISVISISAGEKNKSINTAEFIWKELNQKHADRNSVLINLGGGTISDIGGFVASNYKRGISFINIPTTLMGMVDAAIGGKNAVNLNEIKNSIGTYRQPDSVYINPVFLKTLPQSEILSGYAEIFKYALINDSGLWEILKKKSFTAFESLEDLITYSVLIKAEIVEQDPWEKGIRKTLNFGHTLGHAFETFLNRMNRPVSHGYAVAAGILCESYLSMRINKLQKKEFEAITTTIHLNFPKLLIRENNDQELISIMKNDKKNQQDKINCSLLNQIGEGKYDQLIPEELLIEALNYYIHG